MARDRRICCHDVLLYRTMSHSLLYNVCACVCTHGRTLIMYNSRLLSSKVQQTLDENVHCTDNYNKLLMTPHNFAFLTKRI